MTEYKVQAKRKNDNEWQNIGSTYYYKTLNDAREYIGKQLESDMKIGQKSWTYRIVEREISEWKPVFDEVNDEIN